MDKLIISITSFAIGMIFAVSWFGCRTHAYEDTERRIGEGNWWEYQQQQQQLNDQRFHTFEQELRKTPCP